MLVILVVTVLPFAKSSCRCAEVSILVHPHCVLLSWCVKCPLMCHYVSFAISWVAIQFSVVSVMVVESVASAWLCLLVDGTFLRAVSALSMLSVAALVLLLLLSYLPMYCDP